MVSIHNRVKSEKLSILRMLIENPDKDYTIRQISLKRNINYKSAYYAVMKLKNEGIVDIKFLGNSSIVRFNFNFNESVFIVENWRKKDFLKNKNFLVLYKRIKEIENPFFISIVFGSFANKTSTRGSDVDICTISNENLEELETIFNTTPLNIHHVKFTSDEFLKMLKTNEFNVSKEIVKNKIILKGVEEFYELINHAK